MASDLDLLIGTWIVKVRPPGNPEPWTWEYEFHSDGRVTWEDLKNGERGSGTWAATSKFVNISWKDSSTRESWVRPLAATPPLAKTWYESSYYRGNYKIEKPSCPGFLTDGAVQLTHPGEIYQIGLLCWAAGSASWLRATNRGTATVDDLVEKYKKLGKVDTDGSLPEANIMGVFLDIGISLKKFPAVDFTFCYVREKLISRGHLVLLSGSPDRPMGHTRVVHGVGHPTNEFFDVFDPLEGHGYEYARFSELSGNIYVGWAK